MNHTVNVSREVQMKASKADYKIKPPRLIFQMGMTTFKPGTRLNSLKL